MATESTAHVDEKITILDEEVGGGENEVDKNVKPAITAPASDAAVANELKEEKDMVSDSQTVIVNETAPDPVLTQPEEKPAADNTLKETSEDSEKEPIKNEEPESFTVKSSESSDDNPPTQVDSEKEMKISGFGSIKEDKPEHVDKNEEEKPIEIEPKETIDEEEEQVKTVFVSTLAAESRDKLPETVDPKADSPPKEESTKDTENSELGSTDRVVEVKEETDEPEKESTEKGEEQGGKVLIEEPSAPSDETSDAIESNSPKESNEQEVLKTEPKEEKPQSIATEVEEKPSVQAILTEKLEGEHNANGLAAEDGTSETKSVELAPTEQENHASVIEPSPSEADKVEVAALKKEVNEHSEEEKVEIEELKKEELNEPSAVGVLSREVEEQVPNTQEDQADTAEDEKDSSLAIAAADEVVGIDVENKEVNAEKAEETNEEENVKSKDDIPVIGNEDLHVESKSDQVAEADEQPPASKPDVEEEPTVKTEGRDLEKDQVEDLVKTDVQNPEEPTKESDNGTHTSDNHEVPAKQKQSNNIFVRVKQSFAKAKKAITGKSPNLKTVSSDTKGDITANKGYSESESV